MVATCDLADLAQRAQPIKRLESGSALVILLNFLVLNVDINLHYSSRVSWSYICMEVRLDNSRLTCIFRIFNFFFQSRLPSQRPFDIQIFCMCLERCCNA